MSKYIDPESIYSHFPKDKPVPQRLIELLNWLDIEINDEGGWFPVFCGKFLAYYLDPVDISPYFAVLARLGDGSVLAYWFYEGCDDKDPPVVVLPSGNMEIVANNITEFVARLVVGGFHHITEVGPMLGNFYYFRDPSWMGKIKKRAEQSWGLTDAEIQRLVDLNPKIGHPNLEKWFNDKRL